jgi:hypothetical protein
MIRKAISNPGSGSVPKYFGSGTLYRTGYQAKVKLLKVRTFLMKNIFQYKKFPVYSRLLAVAVAGSKSGVQAGFGAGAKISWRAEAETTFSAPQH